MTPAKRAELIIKHAQARRRLRAEGREESLGNVLGIAGGSKRDIVALWPESDPDTAPMPMTDAEAAFRQTFATYLAAATRFQAISGVQAYALPTHHPWYQQLRDALATAYTAHLAAWETLEGRPVANGRHPEPATRGNPSADILPTSPPPIMAQGLTVDDLRAYFSDPLNHPGWGYNTRLGPAQLPLLAQLHEECEDAARVAGQERWRHEHAAPLEQFAPDSPERREYRLANDRWARAQTMARAVQEAIERVHEDHRYYHGRSLA